MELKVRYENNYRKIEVELSDMEGWLVSINALDISLVAKQSVEDREEAVQTAVEGIINKTDYNNWHTFNRHRGILPKPGRKEDQDKDGFDGTQYLEGIAYARSQKARENYNATCAAVRKALGKKEEWADAVIAVYLDGYTIRDYAAQKEENENNITQKLKRARKKLAKIFGNRQIL